MLLSLYICRPSTIPPELQSGDRLVWKWDPNVVVQMVEQRGEQGLVDE